MDWNNENKRIFEQNNDRKKPWELNTKSPKQIVTKILLGTSGREQKFRWEARGSATAQREFRRSARRPA